MRSAKRVADLLNEHQPGCAASIDGTTRSDDRAETVNKFKAGEIRFLCNCQIATEGFDSPEVETVLIARPTKSRSLFAQMCGRGTRPLPGVVDGPETAAERRLAIERSAKPSCLILDLAGNVGKHRLVSTADILADGELSDEARDAADRLLASGLSLPSDELLAEAKRMASKTRATFIIERVDEFGDLSLTLDDFRIDSDSPAAEWQLRYLNTHGIAKAKLRGLSYGEADAIREAIRRRIAAGKCTLKQAKILRQHGYPTDLGRAAATAIISPISASGWRP